MRRFAYRLIALALLCHIAEARAAPLYVYEGNVKVILYSEECKLEAVSNLKRRATWEENGKVFEGCWGLSPTRMVMFYFDDRTVAAIPAGAFSAVVSS